MYHPRQKPSALACLSLIAALLLPAASFAENPFATWFHQFDPNVGNSPSAKAVAIDPSGFVAVAGFSWTVGGTKIYYIARHDPFTGEDTPGWPRFITSGAGASEANGVVFDSAGNIIVTGQSQSTDDGLDYFTRKYNRAGVEVWSARYDNNGGADLGLFIAVDSNDNVIVTGRSSNGGVSGDDIYTVKYRASDGMVLSSIRYTSPGTLPDHPTGLAIDSQDKVIVCGVTQAVIGDDNFYTAKYDMSALVGVAEWTRTIDSGNGDDRAQDVAVDSADNVIVTGRLTKLGGEHGFFTRKYSPLGATAWSQNYPDAAGDFKGGARSVAVDAAGNVFITGVVDVDNFNTTFYTARAAADDGAIDWQVLAPLFEDVDVAVDSLNPVRIAVDPAGNPIIAGSPRFGTENSDFYIAKYASNSDGAILWERIYGGAFPNGGTDRVRDMAVDPFGNIAITGDALREAGILNEIVTFKIGATALATGDPISGPGIAAGATIANINPPAAANSGTIAARITIAAGRKKLGAIVSLAAGKGLQIPALQGASAPGLSDATFKSFLDPVLAPNGEIAFIGKVSGVKASEATGVWTDAFDLNGNLQLALQQGKEVPGLPTGTLLKSILSLSHRNNQLLALIKVTGKTGGVTGANALVLYRVTGIGTGVPLVRTGDLITVDSVESTIKKITVFTPPKDSVGHGRYHGDTRSIALVTLADRRTAVLAVTSAGTQTIVNHTAKDASSMVTDALWRAISLPAVDASGSRYAMLGTLEIGEGAVTKANDSIIGFAIQGGSFTKVAREGEPAPGIAGALFAKLQDPLTSASRVAFLGTVAGSGVSGKNRAGLWFGLADSVNLVARTNDPGFPATDGAGNALDARWTAFKSLALPNGTGEGPLFIATIAGPGIKGKAGTGLWAVDSDSTIRKLIRVGDQFGDLTVKKFVVLAPAPGSIGATRSFSATRSVALLVTFSNKTTGILNIAIP